VSILIKKGIEMRKKPKLSKAQNNKKIRTILLRHAVDLTHIQFSASNNALYLAGFLLKNTGAEFTNNAVFELADELFQHGHLRSELQNWYISREKISFLGTDRNESA
jgi:hypothetical protein